MKHCCIVFTSSFLLLSNVTYATEPTALISGFARSFITGSPIANATITELSTGRQFNTDSQGHFGAFEFPVGKDITLSLSKSGYKTTQSATIRVPTTGLTGQYDNITFQVPSLETYYLLASIIGANIDHENCHVTATITAYHKTMDDDPQGEPNAIVTIFPAVNIVPFYFDIFKSGPLKGKTNPFTKNLTKTSEDGGVAFFNLPVRNEPYTISAQKNGVVFSQAQFLCSKDAFINVSPPRGPMVE